MTCSIVVVNPTLKYLGETCSGFVCEQVYKCRSRFWMCQSFAQIQIHAFQEPSVSEQLEQKEQLRIKYLDNEKNIWLHVQLMISLTFVILSRVVFDGASLSK